MAIAIKGIMKGIRYITSMFEHEREPQIEIGGPTDVKHVAHIGWDGPTANAPSWMDQFKGEGGDPGATPQQGSRGLPEVTGSPTKPRKGGKHAAGSSEANHHAAKTGRKKKGKASASHQSGGSSASNKKAKGRQAQADCE